MELQKIAWFEIRCYDSKNIDAIFNFKKIYKAFVTEFPYFNG